MFQVNYGKIAASMSMDISTGDIITPGAIQREFELMFNNDKFYLWSYNVETILAEKVETILRRNIFSTRPRDFYDLYILYKMEPLDLDVFHQALYGTALHRDSLEYIKDKNQLLKLISESDDLKNYGVNIAESSLMLVKLNIRILFKSWIICYQMIKKIKKAKIE